MNKTPHVIVIGAGAGGLSAAIDLARRGVRVTVLERSGQIGGKIRQRMVNDTLGIDVGPTVFTMKWIFDELFADAGSSFSDAVTLRPADLLARHAWAKDDQPNGRLDLFADVDQSAEAIAAFASPKEAKGYRDFCAHSAKVFGVLRDSFIRDQRPSQLEVVSRVGAHRLPGWLATIRPWKTLWAELDTYFSDPRLRQLFGRYATYVGSSPLSTPATIMLVAHVEQQGVWLVDGGMRAVAKAMHGLGETLGVDYQFNTHVERIITDGAHACGVVLKDGQELRANAIVFNGDISALGSGLLGAENQQAAPVTKRENRSLSAITWSLNAKTSGFPLAFHNVFFAEHYPREFNAIFKDRAITDMPTLYLCAQDRTEASNARPTDGEAERLFMLMNAPADGDRKVFSADEIEEYQTRIVSLLRICGLTIDDIETTKIVTQPSDFHERFPATGGALYGQATHGMMATMNRTGSKSKIPGLYLTGGSVHPGPGVPMATMSGRLAAAQMVADKIL